ncbi:hypothetical protein ASPU41_17975 [Arthrobacter sp. U41]|nr:hypothetical protein ASPU41_17975 [Arthrobacter sp. U41]
MNAHNSFEEEAVRHFASPRRQAPNRHHRVKHGPDLGFTVGVDEGQDEVDVGGLERLSRSGDYGAIH